MISERDKQIIDLYINHPELSNEDIAKQFNISKATISRIARINNLPRRTGNNGTRLSLKQEDLIIQEYQKGASMISLQHKYCISWETLKKILNKNNIQTVSSAKRSNPQLIENYFHKIDTPEKAYWIGWIISDGSITNNPEQSKFQLELTLQPQDIEILYLLEKDLQVENKIYNSGDKYKRFSLGCKQIIQDLEKIGITQNKTFTVKIPDNIDEKLLPHLLRGLFDGDGGYTIYQRANGQTNRELSFCGNEKIISQVKEILEKNIPNLKHKTIENESSIKRIRWGSLNDIKLIKNFLYKDCNNHYLSRKLNLINADIEVTNQIAQG